jgi:Protein of unknown function (DUF3037)
MSKPRGLYGLIQFSPAPERLEFINIGALLVDVDRRFFGVRFSQNIRRLDRVFGPQSKPYLEALKAGLANRLKAELGSEWNLERLKSFIGSRANSVRISKLLPIVVDDPNADLDELFVTLVGDQEVIPRQPKVASELRKKFAQAGVEKLLEKPAPIELPQGVTIEVPWAYRNGAYNLIEPVRLGGPASEALAQASKRAVEGKWLREFTTEAPKRLVVVGEVTGQELSFVRAISEMMADHDVRFFDIEDIDPLLRDIKLHPLPSV